LSTLAPTTMRVALMGANGFVGSRIAEMFYLGGVAELRPIVRTYSGLAGLSRFDLDGRVANAKDESALAKAFEGCDAVVHSVHGHADVVEGSIQPFYRAACAAGVRRVVYLSSASVHGLAPAPGTDESSPLSDRQALEYNNLKVRAERRLLEERANGTTEVVILRPSIVYGPRDRWISGIATAMMRGSAYLIDDGRGICNGIYVDNLVDAIHKSLTAPAADKEAFLVGDAETVTWAELYRAIAEAFEVNFSEVAQISSSSLPKTVRNSIDAIRGMAVTQAVLPMVPPRLKRVAKATITAWPQPVRLNPWALPGKSAPAATEEMAELHGCTYKLPYAKAIRLLGYTPLVSFQEGLTRSIGWLRFAGYPYR